MTYGTQGVTAYRSEAVQAAEFADPHTLVSMLIDGALQRIAQARGAMANGMTARKGERIGKAIAIIDSLQASLDSEQGGEVADNLARLYDYMNRRLLHANLQNDAAALDEVARLLNDIKSGWDQIGDAAKAAAPASR